VLAELRLQNTDRLTPIDALNLLEAWQRKLREDDPAV